MSKVWLQTKKEGSETMEKILARYKEGETMTVTHFILWRVSPEELECIAKELRKHPLVSLRIDKDVELMIEAKTRRKRNEVV